MSTAIRCRWRRSKRTAPTTSRASRLWGGIGDPSSTPSTVRSRTSRLQRRISPTLTRRSHAPQLLAAARGACTAISRGQWETWSTSTTIERSPSSPKPLATRSTRWRRCPTRRRRSLGWTRGKGIARVRLRSASRSRSSRTPSWSTSATRSSRSSRRTRTPTRLGSSARRSRRRRDGRPSPARQATSSSSS
jgi:hypothetical protein